MKTVKVYISFLLIGIISCNTTEPPPPPPPDNKPTLTFELDDVQCTEAWITLETTNLQLPAAIILKQYNPDGDSISTTINLDKADTLLYIDSLLPNQTYTFQSLNQPINQSEVKSNVLSVKTMDTTSHSFSWQTWEFGEHSSSVLFDVAIIDENNIWAVGAIYMNDSLGNPDTKRYNLAIWDGNDWSIRRAPYYYQGQPFYHPIQAIFAFSANDIWLCGNGVIHWDGIQYNEIPIPSSVWGPYQINKIWGTSSNDLYIVGSTGNIAHYNGQSWSRIESGTELNINDIWGDFNQKTQEWEILAVASNFGTGLEKKILQIKNTIVTKIPPSPQMWPLLTTWFIPNRQYYVAGAGIYQKKLLTDELWKNEALDITTFTTTSIRGSDINDVIGVGAFGDLVHFNGVSWKNDYEQPNLSNGSYGSVTVKTHIIAATGLNSNEAVILLGRR